MPQPEIKPIVAGFTVHCVLLCTEQQPLLCCVCLCFGLHWTTAPIMCVCVSAYTDSPCCLVFQLTLTAPVVLCCIMCVCVSAYIDSPCCVVLYHVCLCFSCHQASDPTVLFQLSCSPSCVVCVSLSWPLSHSPCCVALCCCCVCVCVCVCVFVSSNHWAPAPVVMCVCVCVCACVCVWELISL